MLPLWKLPAQKRWPCLSGTKDILDEVWISFLWTRNVLKFHPDQGRESVSFDPQFLRLFQAERLPFSLSFTATETAISGPSSIKYLCRFHRGRPLVLCAQMHPAWRRYHQVATASSSSAVDLGASGKEMNGCSADAGSGAPSWGSTCSSPALGFALLFQSFVECFCCCWLISFGRW